MVFAIGLLSTYHASAQTPDTSDFYYKLSQKADKHKFTKWVYHGIFRSPSRVQDTISAQRDLQKVNPFIPYQGKTIRSIRIVSLDPFGFSVNDTLKRFPNNIESVGNKYHINTRKYIIKNILLFKRNKTLDPLEVSESERLLRLYPYVNDARIYIYQVDGSSDSVDVTVMVQDKWSAIIGSSFNVNQPNVKLIERNLFGLGHQVEEGITWHPTENTISHAGKYSILNLGKTFINSSIFYASSDITNQWGIAFDRPFYSALAKWAGGASYLNSYTKLKVAQNDFVTVYPLHSHTEDLWVAKNFPVTTRKTSSINKRSDNYMTGLRYYHVDYMERPPFSADSNGIYKDQTMVLNNFGFSKRKYYKDRYLFRFGANEDIPEGYSIEYIHGILSQETTSLWYYSGIKLATGRHYEHFGYVSAAISCGTFYNKNFMGSGALNTDIYYFSDLYPAGRWFFRQFFRWQYTQGLNRKPYESLNINGSQMYGFSSETLLTKSKTLLNLELVIYAPYQVLGFKFAPVLFGGFARTGNSVNDLVNGFTYQAYALGLLIRNEHLITNTFEISIGLYPYVPGREDMLIKYNPVSSYSIKARDYMIGKPELVPYQ